MNMQGALEDYLLKYENFLSKEKNEFITVFTIGNTRISSDSKIYFTPIRKYKNVITAGVIVFSEDEASFIMSKIDGKFNIILVDSEKKSISSNSKGGVFNLERLSFEIIKKSKIARFKGNDLTTNAIEDFISNINTSKGKLLGGSEVFIIGMGNLGFKTSLRLVELGINIFVKNRTEQNIDKLIDAVNIIKPKETIAKVLKFEEQRLMEIIPKLNFIILCTTSYVDGFDRYVPFFRDDITILDVGKGCLPNEMVDFLRKKNILVYRLDIGDALGKYIIGNVINKSEYSAPRFRILSGGSTLITKGIVGINGDVIVDDIDNPQMLYGVCDGHGSFKKLEKNLEKKYINQIFKR